MQSLVVPVVVGSLLSSLQLEHYLTTPTDPRTLLFTKRAMRSVLASKSDQFKIGDSPADEVVCAALEELKDNEEAESLGVKPLLQTAVEARDRLEELNAEVGSYKIQENWKSRREMIERAMEHFDEAFAKVIAYYDVLCTLQKEKKAGQDTEKRQFRSRRDKHREAVSPRPRSRGGVYPRPRPRAA